MNSVLIQNWNSCVKNDDEIYFLGDFMFKGGGEAANKLIEQLNGKKYLTISIKRSDRRRLPTVKDIKSPYKSEAVPSDGIIFHTDESNRRQQIPIYDTKTLTGLVSLFANSHSQPVLEMFETCQMPKCDGGLRIAGDSMYPLIKSGDVVFYKHKLSLTNFASSTNVSFIFRYRGRRIYYHKIPAKVGR